MKEIVINDKIKFYKKLRKYRSFWYRNKIFKTNIDDEEVKEIVEALNIKKRKERLAFIYDNCCKKVDKFNKDKNVCGFNNGVCRYHQELGCNYKNGCCKLCIYQGPTGCRTSNLSCKLFYCKTVTDKFEVMKYSDLKLLKLLTLRQRLIVLFEFFSTREQILFDAYIGSVFFYAIRISYRLIYNFSKIKKLKVDIN